MKWLNERVIAPRAGYASFPDRTVQRRWMIASVLGLGAVMVTLGFFGKLPRLDWMGLGFAILLASFFFGLGIQFRLPHWLFFGVFVLALAGWLFRNGLGIEGGMWLAIWVGSAMVLTGAFRLWRFLHANPIPKDDTP
jgi:hypothetical protein